MALISAWSQHRIAHLGELGGRRPELGVDELTPGGPEQHPTRHQAGAVEGTTERDHRRLGDHRFVEVEEGGGARIHGWRP
jgi:hypothetical protein